MSKARVGSSILIDVALVKLSQGRYTAAMRCLTKAAALYPVTPSLMEAVGKLAKALSVERDKMVAVICRRDQGAVDEELAREARKNANRDADFWNNVVANRDMRRHDRHMLEADNSRKAMW